MKMKKTALILSLIFFAAGVHALALQKLAIAADVSDNGAASIVENYELAFENISEKIQFIDNAQKNSSSMLAWKADYDFFYPHFEATDNRVIRSTITFEQSTNTITLEYELEKPLMTIVKDAARETRYEFSGRQLNSFIKDGLIVIPNNAEISIMLPQKAQIAGQDSVPQIEISQNKITIKPLSTSQISVQYSIQKPISTKVNSLELVRDFFTDSSNLVVIIAALVALAVIFWKKDDIEGKIEDYILKHSEIAQGEAEEEVELQV